MIKFQTLMIYNLWTTSMTIKFCCNYYFFAALTLVKFILRWCCCRCPSYHPYTFPNSHFYNLVRLSVFYFHQLNPQYLLLVCLYGRLLMIALLHTRLFVPREKVDIRAPS